MHENLLPFNLIRGRARCGCNPEIMVVVERQVNQLDVYNIKD
jgi:hypothetical protein